MFSQSRRRPLHFICAKTFNAIASLSMEVDSQSWHPSENPLWSWCPDNSLYFPARQSVVFIVHCKVLHLIEIGNHSQWKFSPAQPGHHMWGQPPHSAQSVPVNGGEKTNVSVMLLQTSLVKTIYEGRPVTYCLDFTIMLTIQSRQYFILHCSTLLMQYYTLCLFQVGLLLLECSGVLCSWPQSSQPLLFWLEGRNISQLSLDTIKCKYY